MDDQHCMSFICFCVLKGKGRALDIAPQVDKGHQRRSGAWRASNSVAPSHVPAIYLPSCSRYSFTDHERM